MEGNRPAQFTFLSDIQPSAEGNASTDESYTWTYYIKGKNGIYNVVDYKAQGDKFNVGEKKFGILSVPPERE